MERVERKFNYRSFCSIGLFLSGLSLPLSGFINHELQLEELTPIREFWMTFHNSAGILFFILAIFHVIFNRKALINHLTKAKGTILRREALMAIVFVTLLIISISSHAFL
ncbi:DUF4405 domain-containing protein [Marinifilum sp. N1E240]|uniref:DUF4405 domain-containing protein n=1 Tax=Marinifilum sp. N1E240 TaxID=2608082 RepID=UPI00128C3E33|nr:DUF4405 domain-containing protein [Marinifilum sp. N1E240]